MEYLKQYERPESIARSQIYKLGHYQEVSCTEFSIIVTEDMRNKVQTGHLNNHRNSMTGEVNI